MNALEFAAMVDETKALDGRQYPTLDDYSAALAIVRAREAQPVPTMPKIERAPLEALHVYHGKRATFRLESVRSVAVSSATAADVRLGYIDSLSVGMFAQMPCPTCGLPEFDGEHCTYCDRRRSRVSSVVGCNSMVCW